MWNYIGSCGDIFLSPQGGQSAELATEEPGDARHHWALSPGALASESFYFSITLNLTISINWLIPF